MMSYLWILLLGSLLAASAKAQDYVAPTEEAAAPETPDPDAEAAPEINGEPGADKETHHTGEEMPTMVSEPESTADPEDGVEEPLGDEDAEPETPTDGDTETVTTADEDAEPETPTDGDTETVTTADEDAEPTTPTDGDAEAATPTAAAAAGTEEEAAATTQEPADPGVEDTETEQPTVNGEEETTLSTDAAPTQESGLGDEVAQATDPAAEESEEEPTDPAADEDPSERLVTVLDPTIKAGVAGKVNADVGFDLENALPEDTAEHNQGHPGKSRSFESGAHAAGATGNDKPEAQEASSGSLAAIVSAIAVTVVGAVVGYFTYQKKKLCFKNRQEADPEAARKTDAAEAQSDPQVLSNLLNSS